MGPNDGEKIKENDQIIISKKDQKFNYKKLDHVNSKIEHIRVIKGTNYNYFSQEAKNVFFSKEYTISKFTDRMGMRLEGPKIENIGPGILKINFILIDLKFFVFPCYKF